MNSPFDPSETYTVKFIANTWGVSTETARRRLIREHGVMRFGNEGSGKRPYHLTTIPGKVANRITERYTNK